MSITLENGFLYHAKAQKNHTWKLSFDVKKRVFHVSKNGCIPVKVNCDSWHRTFKTKEMPHYIHQQVTNLLTYSNQLTFCPHCNKLFRMGDF